MARPCRLSMRSCPAGAVDCKVEVSACARPPLQRVSAGTSAACAARRAARAPQPCRPCGWMPGAAVPAWGPSPAAALPRRAASSRSELPVLPPRHLTPQVELMPGVMMPMVGYGTAGLTDLTADAVFTAIRVGYRLVDSAGVRASLATPSSGVCCAQAPRCFTPGGGGQEGRGGKGARAPQGAREVVAAAAASHGCTGVSAARLGRSGRVAPCSYSPLRRAAPLLYAGAGVVPRRPGRLGLVCQVGTAWRSMDGSYHVALRQHPRPRLPPAACSVPPGRQIAARTDGVFGLDQRRPLPSLPSLLAAALSASTSSSLPSSTPDTTATGACSRCVPMAALATCGHMKGLCTMLKALFGGRLLCCCAALRLRVAAFWAALAVATCAALRRTYAGHPSPWPSHVDTVVRPAPRAMPQVFGETLQDLQTDYVDLMLLHYPE